MDILNLAIIFFVAMAGGSFGSLIGGTSILTIPTLILLGLPPHTAIGTDRFGIIGIGIAGWYEFHRQKLINYRIGLIVAVPVLFGTILGSNLVLQIKENVLRDVILAINVILIILVLLNQKIGVEARVSVTRRHEVAIALLVSFLVGVYGGFYGALAGTFTLYIFLLWFGQTFIQGAATQKIASIFMTVTAATVFALHKAVDFRFGGAMFLGCLIGSYFGAHYASRIGNVWVRRLFTGFMIFVIAKLVISR
jgi:hypothetical protein